MRQRHCMIMLAVLALAGSSVEAAQEAPEEVNHRVLYYGFEDGTIQDFDPIYIVPGHGTWADRDHAHSGLFSLAVCVGYEHSLDHNYTATARLTVLWELADLFSSPDVWLSFWWYRDGESYPEGFSGVYLATLSSQRTQDNIRLIRSDELAEQAGVWVHETLNLSQAVRDSSMTALDFRRDSLPGYDIKFRYGGYSHTPYTALRIDDVEVWLGEPWAQTERMYVPIVMNVATGGQEQEPMSESPYNVEVVEVGPAPWMCADRPHLCSWPEFIGLFNLEPYSIDMDGWTLRHVETGITHRWKGYAGIRANESGVEFTLHPHCRLYGQGFRVEVCYGCTSPCQWRTFAQRDVWANSPTGTVELYDDEGRLVDRRSYDLTH